MDYEINDDGKFTISPERIKEIMDWGDKKAGLVIDTEVVNIKDKDYKFIRVTSPRYPDRFLDYRVYSKTVWVAEPAFESGAISDDTTEEDVVEYIPEHALRWFEEHEGEYEYKKWLLNRMKGKGEDDIIDGNLFVRVTSPKDPERYQDFWICQMKDGRWDIHGMFIDNGLYSCELKEGHTMEDLREAVRKRGIEHMEQIDYKDYEYFLAYMKFLVLEEKKALSKREEKV